MAHSKHSTNVIIIIFLRNHIIKQFFSWYKPTTQVKDETRRNIEIRLRPGQPDYSQRVRSGSFLFNSESSESYIKSGTASVLNELLLNKW